MKTRIKPLPHWCLTDLQPAFYDVESVTAIEMVSKLYGKMEQLICDYNMYIDQLNKYIHEFECGIIKDFNEFKCCITKTINDYIATIDMKINLQDTKISNKFEEIDTIINNQNNSIDDISDKVDNQNDVIAQAVSYMETNLTETVNNLFNELLENGEFVSTISITYDDEAERIDIMDTLTHAESEEY